MKLFKAKLGNPRKSIPALTTMFLILLISIHGSQQTSTSVEFAGFITAIMGALTGTIVGWLIYYQLYSENGDWWLTYLRGFELFLGVNAIAVTYLIVVMLALLIKMPWLPKTSLVSLIAWASFGKCVSLLAARITWGMDDFVRGGVFILSIIGLTEVMSILQNLSTTPIMLVGMLVCSILIELVILVGGEPRWSKLKD